MPDLCDEYLSNSPITYECVRTICDCPHECKIKCDENIFDDLYSEIFCDCGTTYAVFSPYDKINDWYTQLTSVDWRDFGELYVNEYDYYHQYEPDWN